MLAAASASGKDGVRRTITFDAHNQQQAELLRVHRLAHALRRFQIAALLDAMETSDHLGRQDGLHGQRTDLHFACK
jgi:hypothetical protein